MSENPRLKIHWGGSEITPGEWHLGLVGRYERKATRGRRRRGWVVSIRGLVCWVASFAVCIYLGVAAYVWQKQTRSPHNEVTYADMVLYPVRKQEIREKRGRAMIAEGQDALEAGAVREGFMLLRQGLERYPHDAEARLKVVRFFLSARLRSHAQEYLRRGLDHGWPGRDYLEAALAIVAASEDHELGMEICDRALGLHDPATHSAADRRWLHAQRVRATLGAGENEAALAYLDEHAVEMDEDVLHEIRLLALFALGRAADALALIEQWRANEGDTVQILRLAVRTYRENGRLSEMDAALESLRRLAPADPRVRVYAIIQTLLAGRETEARAQIDDYIFRFGGDRKNFSTLAAPLGDIVRLPELDTVLAAAAERGFRDSELGMVRLRALISLRRFVEARAQVAAIRSGLKTGEPPLTGLMLDYYEALLGALLDPARGAQSSFVDKVRPLQLSLAYYRQAIALLRAEGRVATARQIVTYAEGVFPDNAFFISTRHELDAELVTIAAAEIRKEEAPDSALANAGAFFAALDAIERSGDSAAGLALIRDLRRQNPGWLEEEQKAVTRAELNLLAAGDDLVALQSVARVYLNGNQTRSRTVTILAGELHAQGRVEKARLLLDEVLRRTPDDAHASQVRDELFPPAKPTAP